LAAGSHIQIALDCRGWAFVWSLFVLRASAANKRIIVRGTIQSFASAVLLIGLVLLFLKFAKNFNELSEDQRMKLQNEDEYNKQRDSFCDVFFKNTDERFVVAMLFILIPFFPFLLQFIT